jgi:TPR repeat protein
MINFSEEENNKILEQKIKDLESTKNDLNRIKIEKDNYMTFLESFFNEIEETLQQQNKSLNSDIEIISTKEAGNLEEILQISKQLEWIHQRKSKNLKLKVEENFQNLMLNSISLNERQTQVPREIYQEIDLLRHFYPEKLIELVDKYNEDYDDLCLKSWKGEAIFMEKNDKTILNEITQVKKAKDGFDLYAIGKAFSVLGNEVEANKWWKLRFECSLLKISAETGNYLGECNYGRSFETGDGGFTINLDKAIEYYKKSNEKGYFRSQNFLASIYRDRNINDPESFDLYFLAAKQGYCYAQFNVGLLLDEGNIPNNYGDFIDIKEESKKWFKKSASLGFQDAQDFLDSME